MPSKLVRIFGRAKAVLTLSLPDVCLAAVLVGLLGRAEATQRLLADGDTGWYIRTGALILASGSVPAHDPFSSSWRDAPVLSALLLITLLPPRMAFSESRFPITAVSANTQVLTPGRSRPRILTFDQWGDDLIFRLYSRQRVSDGRSDFYRPALGRDDRELQAAEPRRPEIFVRYNFGILLLPTGCPLARMLERDTSRHPVCRDSVAQWMTRRPFLKNPCGAPMGME